MSDQAHVRHNRRSVLTAAAGAVAATAAGAVTTPFAAMAAGDDTAVIRIGNGYEDVRSATELRNASNGNDVFRAKSNGGGTGIVGYSKTGWGVLGQSDSGTGTLALSFSGIGLSGHSETNKGIVGSSANDEGVFGSSNGSIGVHGRSYATVGVFGEAPGGAIGVDGIVVMASPDQHEAYGVRGLTNLPRARGVFGWNQNPGAGAGVWGQADGAKGVGVRGYAWDDGSGKFGTGVVGTSGSHAFPPPVPLPNTGVYGIGKNGRGGVFKGDKAQVRLIPSAAPNHPASGALGDLFLDHNKRLWFCAGGTSWKRLA